MTNIDLISDLRSIVYNDEALIETIDLCSDKRDFIDDDGMFDSNIGDRLDELDYAVEIYKNDPTENKKESIDAELEYFRELTQDKERLQNLKPIVEPFEEEEEEAQISNQQTNLDEPEIATLNETDNNILPVNKYNMIEGNEEFNQSAFYDENDVNPFEDPQPDENKLGDFH